MLIAIPIVSHAMESNSRFNSNRKGDQALNFAFYYDFVLSSFKNNAVSYQVFPWNNWALRGGVSYWSRNYEIRHQTGLSDGPYYYDEGSEDLEEWNRGFISRVQITYYTQSQPVSAFIGAGPYVEFRRSRYDNVYFQWGDYEFYQTREAEEYKSSYIGGEVSVGVHLPLASRFAIHAEYGGKLVYEKTDRVRQYWNEIEFEESYLSYRESKGWDFNMSSIVLGLSVYF